MFIEFIKIFALVNTSSRLSYLVKLVGQLLMNNKTCLKFLRVGRYRKNDYQKSRYQQKSNGSFYLASFREIGSKPDKKNFY